LDDTLVSSTSADSGSYTRNIDSGMGEADSSVSSSPVPSSTNPVDLDGLLIALKSYEFSNYIRASDSTYSPVTSQTSIGPWEKWTL
jgi:hypothetical protein